jgi:EAL domain-containing protein (putative c-di-GMP-specific phosphodiesterase class I)
MLDTKIRSREVSGASAEVGTVVIVDDSRTVLKLLELALDGTAKLRACSNGADAVAEVRRGGVDVVVTDITMPGMTGLDLLRAIREYDADLPVVLLTGRPTVESAAEAIEHGVFRYLTKPFQPDALRATVRQASQLYRLARIKREALGLAGVVGPSDRVGLEVTFRHALASLSLAFQPIVSVTDRTVVAYEALIRSAEPALPGPLDVIGAAERLGALFDVGRLVRTCASNLFRKEPPSRLLFLNLHPRDLLDPELVDSSSVLAPIAHRVVLEVTERASLERIADVRSRVAVLRSRGYRIAIDDLGAGFAGLTSFAVLEPDIVKVDISLTRDVDQSSIKQKIIRAMTTLCHEMGMHIVAEGVETRAERDTLVELGCDLLQGYLFAHPGPPFPEASW